MSYSEVKRMVDYITDKLDKHNVNYAIHHSCKSSSMYIKMGKPTIRVSDHSSRTDHYCKYNIGSHITNFRKARNSYYYRYDRVNNMIKRVLKDLKDNKKKRQRRK